MIDYTQDYTELLQYQKLLDTAHPTEAGGTPWVEDCLSQVGWKKGDPIPGGMGDYIAAILDHLNLKKTSKNVKDIFGIDEVRLSIQNAIRAVYEVKHSDEIAQEKAKEMMGNDADFSNPLVKKLYDAAVRASEKSTKETNQDNTPSIVSAEDATQILNEDNKKEVVESVPIKQEQNYNVCPCCGINLNEPFSLPELTDTEKRGYLMHVVGGARFYKSYPLWGGVASVLFQTPTIEEEAVFDEYYSTFVDKYRADANFQKLLRHYQECRLALLVKEIKVGNKVIASTPGLMSSAFAPQDGRFRLQVYIENWYNKSISSKEMKDALNVALDRYLKDINELQKVLYNQDFWKGEILN